MDKNIVLLGFMGTGKTAIGKKLAVDLNMQFVEVDSIIEGKEGVTINEIFSVKGEPFFRKVEADVVKELSKKKGLVISAGGGVVLNPDNIREMQRNGILICLNAAPEEIYKRIKGEGQRPLLNVKDPLKKIKELLDYRKPYYNRINLQIDTTGKSVEEVVKEVKEQVKCIK